MKTYFYLKRSDLLQRGKEFLFLGMLLFIKPAFSANLNDSHWFYDLHLYDYTEKGVSDTSRLPAVTLGYRNNQGLKSGNESSGFIGNYEFAVIPSHYSGSGTSDSFYTKFLTEIYLPIKNTLYTGIGYRNHYDHSGFQTTSTGYSGYDRLSQYLYLPLGSYYPISNGFLKTQINYLIIGQQTSYFSQISGYKNNIQNIQKNGYGLDFSYMPNTSKYEIYWRYWNIGDSNTDASYFTSGSLNGYYYEPANKTNELGVRLAF
jgi:hypothetical protein